MKFKAEFLIKLKKDGSKEAVDAFIEEFWENTTHNPFSNRERVWQNVAGIECVKWEGCIHLSFIRSFEKGTGAGSAALKWLCQLADKHGVPIELHAKPVGKGGLTANKLREWYMRHGFKSNGSKYDLIRQPKIG